MCKLGNSLKFVLVLCGTLVLGFSLIIFQHLTVSYGLYRSYDDLLFTDKLIDSFDNGRTKVRLDEIYPEPWDVVCTLASYEGVKQIHRYVKEPLRKPLKITPSNYDLGESFWGLAFINNNQDVLFLSSILCKSLFPRINMEVATSAKQPIFTQKITAMFLNQT